MVHPHLQHRDIMDGLQTQQLQRQAEVVVQVALRLQHVKGRPQHLRDTLLGGRLAGRARDADHALVAQAGPLRPRPVRHGLQGAQHAVADGVGQAQQTALVYGGRRQPALAHHGRHGSVGQRGFHILVPVHTVAMHRKEQVARGQRARVNRIAGRLGVGVDVAFGVQQVSNLTKGERHLSSLASVRWPPNRQPLRYHRSA